jgi:hypothetical protein
MEASKGGRPRKTQEGDHPSFRTKAASDASLSEHQRKQALRIANVPEGAFNAQIDSTSPPTLGELAAQSTLQAVQYALDPGGMLGRYAPRWSLALKKRSRPLCLKREIMPVRRPSQSIVIQGIPESSQFAMQRHHLGAGLQAVQVVTPRLHHAPPLVQVLGAVVGRPDPVALRMR